MANSVSIEALKVTSMRVRNGVVLVLLVAIYVFGFFRASGSLAIFGLPVLLGSVGYLMLGGRAFVRKLLITAVPVAACVIEYLISGSADKIHIALFHAVLIGLGVTQLWDLGRMMTRKRIAPD